MDGNAIYHEIENTEHFSLECLSNLVYVSQAGQEVVDDTALELRRELSWKKSN